MLTISKRKPGFIFTFLLAAMLLPVLSFSQTTIEIQVSPNVLNLQNNGQVVTIHTEIAYSLVVGETVYLNDVEIQSWKSDNQGNFVAKFNMDAIQGLESLVVDEYNLFTLVGLQTDGSTFTGEQEVLIVNNVPVGQGKK